MNKNYIYKFITSILIISYSNFCIAQDTNCAQPSSLIQKGAIASCTGWLFSNELQSSLFKMSEDYKLLTQEDQLKDKEITDLQQQVSDLTKVVSDEKKESSDWQNRAEQVSKDMTNIESNRDLKNAMFIGLGVLLTLASGLAIGAVAKH